ncbi:MAG: chemotaxis-specific protein-glutamate methyltransferase CheB [Desulfamplus sp.]|nr:chemotaxis-specific protein-glutamate methyltransferase CheB [Desulfamplus sp.]
MTNKAERSIRVLIVDDSPLVRDIVCAILTSDPEIAIVGEAGDGIQAVSKAISLKPDIVTMDIEMPILDGLEAISRIMADRPTPILVITSLSGVRTAFNAVSKGALDVIEKSNIDEADGAILIKKVKMLAGIDVAAHQSRIRKKVEPPFFQQITDNIAPKDALQKKEQKKKIIAIAASTGGPNAICTILSKLPQNFPTPIVIAQHVAAGFTQGMAEWLNTCTPLTVKPATNGEILTSGRVYLNPSESAMEITRDGMILLFDGAGSKQLYHPSCDHLLSSVAQSFKSQSIAVILSGMGSDGVAGMRAIKAAGGLSIAQDESSSVVFGMNAIAIEKGAVDQVLPLSAIADYIMSKIE